MATFDKWGVPVALGSRTISVSPYKTLLLITTGVIAISVMHSRRRFRDHVDRVLLRIIVASVVVQTLASLAGLALNSGTANLSSEVYHGLQRSSVLLLPWLAFHSGMSPQTLLSTFVGAVLLHDGFIALQYVSPAYYRAFAELVTDPYRNDNARLWQIEGDWFDFVGLQTTSNYGMFAAIFGLLIMGWRVRGFAPSVVKWSVFAGTLVMAVLSPSRSVMIMTVVGLAVIVSRQRLLLRGQTFAVSAVAACLILSYIAVSGLPARSSFYAFIDPDRQGSNDGHFDRATRSLVLIQDSPIVGYGARRFTDLLNMTAIDFDETAAETHSYYLSILVQGGIVSLAAYTALMVAVVRRLWSRRAEPAYASLCGLTVGLLFYNIAYDAGALDVFACFNGVAAYWAMTAAARAEVQTVPQPQRAPLAAAARLRNSIAPMGRRLASGSPGPHIRSGRTEASGGASSRAR